MKIKLLLLLYCLMGLAACQKKTPAILQLVKGKYTLYDDKPFYFRPCQPQTDSISPKTTPFEVIKDTALTPFSYLITDSLQFAHLPQQNGWLKVKQAFAVETYNYLKFLFPIDRPRHECSIWDIYPFENANYLYFIHSLYNQNTQTASKRYYLIDVPNKNIVEIDMKLYKMCRMENKKCLVCEQLNGQTTKIYPFQ